MCKFALITVSIVSVSLFANTSNDSVANDYYHIVPFEYRPLDTSTKAYRMDQAADKHLLIIPKNIDKTQAYPVVIGFHGQPKRGKNPRDYRFQKVIRENLTQLYETGIAPFILVLPVFRFYGQNWPGFDPLHFKKSVTKKLTELGIQPSSWSAFGHSGAAGCGGQGLNTIHRINPSHVGFFDTCLGKGWQNEIRTLQKKRIQTLNIHSVETAGFRPRQRPEYQSNFDFGQAYEPLGIHPVPCKGHPGERLRNQPYRCAATKDGVVRSFVVDSGEGKEAHEALLPLAFRYFISDVLSLKK